MKKLVFTILIVVITMALFAQPVKTTCNYDSAALRIKPSVDSTCIVTVPIGAPITVLAIANAEFYKVSFKTYTGYMRKANIIHIVTDKNGYNHNDYELLERVPYEDPSKEFDRIMRENTDITIEGARKAYGVEDKRSQYKSGDLDSVTLTWRCANGKYRSITYVLKKEYVKESEYVSDCI